MAEDQRVVVKRLDSGPTREPGNYRCTECEWEGVAIRFQVAYEHGPKHHLGRRVKVTKPGPRSKKTHEELLETQRRLSREHYQRKKVSSGSSIVFPQHMARGGRSHGLPC